MVGIELYCGSKVPEMRDVQGYPRAEILHFLKHQLISNSKLKGFKQSSNHCKSYFAFTTYRMTYC